VVTTRRKPQRAGILNIWEYDDQEFDFGDGRLVLRGRNGSGKSNALSLLFPFLFDAVMGAPRMDPMGGSRSMRSLLLCRDDDDPTGSRFRDESATGYVWMEFAGDGGSDHITIGTEDVYSTADEYRRRVDRELFGLGPDRYRTLTELQLTLRRPQLAAKLDLDHVSATLSAGLAELDTALLDDIAHSFDDLDAMAVELDGIAS
jgi:hypothetical protein